MSSPASATTSVSGRTGLDRSPAGAYVQSVERAARLLRAVAEAGRGGASTVALAEACGLNRATAWRILSTLEAHGLVAGDRDSGSWSIGAGTFGLVRAAGQEAQLYDAREILERLALQTGETAALALPRNGGLAYVEEVAPPSVVTAHYGPGPVSLHATSAGKVLLAWSSEETLMRLLPRRLQSFTDSTITDLEMLRADLDQVRQRGYSTCAGEYDPTGCGVAAPVLDRSGRLLAIVTVWGPPPRVAPERFPVLGSLTTEAAARMAPL